MPSIYNASLTVGTQGSIKCSGLTTGTMYYYKITGPGPGKDGGFKASGYTHYIYWTPSVAGTYTAKLETNTGSLYDSSTITVTGGSGGGGGTTGGDYEPPYFGSVTADSITIERNGTTLDVSIKIPVGAEYTYYSGKIYASVLYSLTRPSSTNSSYNTTIEASTPYTFSAYDGGGYITVEGIKIYNVPLTQTIIYLQPWARLTSNYGSVKSQSITAGSAGYLVCAVPEGEKNSNLVISSVSGYVEQYNPGGYSNVTISIILKNNNPRSCFSRAKAKFRTSPDSAWVGFPSSYVNQNLTTNIGEWISSGGTKEITFTAPYYLVLDSNRKGYVEYLLYGGTYITPNENSGEMDTFNSDTIHRFEITLQRPSKFYWKNSSNNLETNEIISTYITAEKWGELQNNINRVRLYRDKSSYPFTYVSSGNRITASLYNEIADAINAMKSGAVTKVSKGDRITASVMNKLQTAINGIT